VREITRSFFLSRHYVGKTLLVRVGDAEFELATSAAQKRLCNIAVVRGDEHTVAFPNYDGNGMYLSTGNVLANPNVGMLFISFERGRRLRLNGVASIEEDDELMESYPEAQFIVRVRAREVFPNCPRYIHKYQLVERSRFVPKAGCSAPVAGWKRSEWARDVLPANDPSRS
jgi:uncharacterized protein